MTSRPRKPSAEARLAEIRRVFANEGPAVGHNWNRKLLLGGCPCDPCRFLRRIYRLTAPARGRKKR